MRLNRERLVAAAFDLVDEEGAEALSMRMLAARVDRQVSSLYNHVAGRGELIEAMRARIVEGIDIVPFADADADGGTDGGEASSWDIALERWARSYLRAFAAHPNLIRLLATTSIRDRSTYAMYDSIVAGLERGGWPEGQVIAVIRTVEAHVLGSALDIVAPGDMLDQTSVDPHFSYVRSALDPRNATAYGATAAFELGLTALIDGLRLRLEAANPSDRTGGSDG
ncbi:TetR/AcrR family transcriptional regulator [Brevibacterium sp. GP-SGM9]|uniref:TetR/AcrR family transcriptional regulator n=1 Tax=Brevibacterium sp. GP-SGM9 TaxID=3376990 RepID=UPI0039A469A8